MKTPQEATQTNKPAWEVDDECLFAFRRARVSEVSPDGRVTGVACGIGTTYSSDFTDQIFPIDSQGLLISDTFKSFYERLRRDAAPANLNYPDIRWWFEQLWGTCMRNRSDAVVVERDYSTLDNFVREALYLASEQRKITVDGVRLFR